MSDYQRLRPAPRRSALRGAVTVEFALLLLPLLLIAFGVAEYSRALYQYNALIKSARDAVRYIAQRNPAEPVTYSAALDETRCLAVHGNTSCSGPALVPGLTTDMISIMPVLATTATGMPIAMIEVRISGYSFAFAFNPLNFSGDTAQSLRFGDIHATMRQI